MTIYERMMQKANSMLEHGLMYAHHGSEGTMASDKMSKEQGLSYISRVMAYAELARKYGDAELEGNDRERELFAEAEKRSKEIAKSPELEVFQDATARELSRLMGNLEGKEWKPVSYEEFMERFNRFPEEHAKYKEEKERQRQEALKKDVTNQLDELEKDWAELDRKKNEEIQKRENKKQEQPDPVDVEFEEDKIDLVRQAVLLKVHRDNALEMGRERGREKEELKKFEQSAPRKVEREYVANKLADILADYDYSLDPKYQSMTLEQKNSEKVEKEKEQWEKAIKKSTAFRNLIDGKNDQELLELIAKPKGDDEWVMRDRAEIMADLERETKKRMEKKEPAKSLAAQLRATESRGFSGALKSFFVGNSQEYERALKAMDGLADGTVTDKDAKDAITAYLDIRKNKVRDHEYGRERFDGFMRGLKLVMKPDEFEAYCDSVDQARSQRSNGKYTGKTHADDYYPVADADQLMADMGKKAADKNYKPTEREMARMLAITQLSGGRVNRDMPLDPKKVREQTDILMDNEAFRMWAKHQSPADVRHAMRGGAGDRIMMHEDFQRVREAVADGKQEKDLYVVAIKQQPNQA